jgi:hypothetical protein
MSRFVLRLAALAAFIAMPFSSAVAHCFVGPRFCGKFGQQSGHISRAA